VAIFTNHGYCLYFASYRIFYHWELDKRGRIHLFQNMTEINRKSNRFCATMQRTKFSKSITSQMSIKTTPNLLSQAHTLRF
jgi:hypothetical protein